MSGKRQKKLRKLSAEFGLSVKLLAKIWLEMPEDKRSWDQFENDVQIFAYQNGLVDK